MNAPPILEPLGNVEAEAALLGAMMQTAATIDQAADRLTAEDFAEPLHGRIFTAILKEHSLGRTANPVTLKQYFVDDPSIKELGGVGYMGQLTGIASFGARDLADQIADLAKRRRLIEGLNSVIVTAQAYDEEPAESLVEQIDTVVSDAMRSQESGTSISAAKCIGEVADGFSDTATGVQCRIIPTLDHVLGRIRAGDLVVLAGRPAMGKTACALSYGIGAAQSGYGVMFASLEMRAQQLGGRMAADMLFDTPQRIPYQLISEGTVNAQQRREVARVADQSGDLPFQIEDLPSVTIGKLNSLVRRQARRFAAKGGKLNLVIVDYLQLVRPDHRENNPYAAISEVSRGLKAMAKAHGVGVLALAQLSREVEKRADKRPQLSDLRDSGQIEQDADAVVFLFRPEEYLMREQPRDDSEEWRQWRDALGKVEGRIEFIVAKRRNGRTGVGHGEWHGEYQAVRG